MRSIATNGDDWFRLLHEAQMELAWNFPSYVFGDNAHFGVAVTDGDGEVAAASNPGTVASIQRTIDRALSILGPIGPGETILTNDPYSGGTVLKDHMAIEPLFSGGAHVGYIVVVAPFADTGGQYFGGWFGGASEIWQEGTRMTPARIRRNGIVVEDAANLLVLNSRVAELARANVRRMLAVIDGLAARVADQLPEWGALCRDRIGDTAAQFRERLAALPGHMIQTEASIPHSCTGRSLKVVLSARYDGEQLHLDFTGSSEQGDGNQNATLSTTLNAICLLLHASLGRQAYANAGLLSAVSVSAPERSIVNAALPVAVGGSQYEPAAQIMSALLEVAEPLWDDARRPKLPVRPQLAFSAVGCGGGDCSADRSAPLSA